MTERNECIETGCDAACCRYGSWFRGEYKEREVIKAFPTAQRVSPERFDAAEQEGPGVYYHPVSFGVKVRIVGQCPNLNPYGECSGYENLLPDCANLGICSEDCVEFRRRAMRKARRSIPLQEIQVVTAE